MPELEPITREEKFLNGEVGMPPITREEKILAGEDIEPITRREYFLKKYRGGGGGDITIEEITVTENGTTTAPTGKAYSPIHTNVPQPTLSTLEVSANGNYNAPTGTAYNRVEVNIEESHKFAMSLAQFKETSMSFNFGIDEINVVWNGSTSIGAQLYGLINLNGYSKVRAKGHATTSYWNAHPDDIYKLELGLSSVKATAPAQINRIDYVKYGADNEDFTMEMNIPENTECYMYFTCSGYNIQGLQLEAL